MTMQPSGWYPDPADQRRQRWWDGNAWGVWVARDGRTWHEPLPPVPPVQHRGRRMPLWAWLLIGVVVVIAMFLLSPLIATIALVVLITGIVALAKQTRTWLRIGSRKAAIAVTSAAAVVFLVAGSVSAATLPNRGSDAGTDRVSFAASTSADEEKDRAETPRPTPTPTPVETTREEVVTEAVAFTETTVDDPALPQGQTQVRTPGQNGEKTLTYVVRLVDGEEVSRELVSDVVTTEPVAQVIAVGTYVAPSPPPAPAPAPAQPGGGCDPNYAEACVPIDSDVDCAGGSGNGPSYFNGVARIVGSDIYDLDRDKDGYACEPW
jgi:hypothetical protein